MNRDRTTFPGDIIVVGKTKNENYFGSCVFYGNSNEEIEENRRLYMDNSELKLAPAGSEPENGIIVDTGMHIDGFGQCRIIGNGGHVTKIKKTIASDEDIESNRLDFREIMEAGCRVYEWEGMIPDRIAAIILPDIDDAIIGRNDNSTVMKYPREIRPGEIYTISNILPIAFEKIDCLLTHGTIDSLKLDDLAEELYRKLGTGPYLSMGISIFKDKKWSSVVRNNDI